MLVRERLASQSWVPPWLRHQHLARYDWARAFCAGKRVLDAACGNGYGSRILRQDARAIGADLAAEAIVDGLSLLSEAPLLLADTTLLPFAKGQFDVFVSFETIEHVADDAGYVAEARRVVAPDGIFLCSTPNRRLVNAGKTIDDRPFNAFHVREYDSGELQRLLEGSFSSVTMLGQTMYAGVYARALAAIGRVWPLASVRLHQVRKLALMPMESRGKHEPVSVPTGCEPEVLLAICQ
jgi:2-polyprenyl-3-methyl-5-hydroxy-6-metoxy-1,4-benzoquinol methylase